MSTHIPLFKLFSLTLFISIILSGCSVPDSDADLAQKVFEAVKNNDAKALMNCVVAEEDIKFIDSHSSLSARDKYRIKKKMVREIFAWKAKVNERLSRTRKHAEWVDWNSAELDHIKNRAKIKNGLEQSDIVVYFHDKERSWIMRLDDCIKLDRGWVMMDDVSCDYTDKVTQ